MCARNQLSKTQDIPRNSSAWESPTSVQEMPSQLDPTPGLGAESLQQHCSLNGNDMYT